MAVTTHSLLKRLHRLKRVCPFDLFFVPVLASGGQPANVDPQRYMLVTRFEPDQSRWIDSVCFNINDPNDARNTGWEPVLIPPLWRASDSRDIRGTSAPILLSPGVKKPWSRRRAIPAEDTRSSAEASCNWRQAPSHRKEVDRRWEEGDDLDAMRQTPIEYTRKASRAPREPLVQPSLSLSRLIRNIGIRKLIRQGFGRRIIDKISRRELVKASTFREYERRRQRQKHSL